MASDNNNLAFTHILGQGRVNQLGGIFINGRPLPQQTRLRIIEMHANGVKPCQISRQLRVSHGAVSKILNRYAETGSICPGQIGGNPRARIPIQTVEKQVLDIFDACPDFSPAEIRDKLIEKNVCARQAAPTVSSIARLLRSFRSSSSSSSTSSSCTAVALNAEPTPSAHAKKRLSHSIDSILGLSEDDSKSYTSTSSSDDDSALSPGEPRRNRTSFTTEQLEILEEAFRTNTYPDTAEKMALAERTRLAEDKIMTWFSNRRARCRKSLPLNLAVNFLQQHPPLPPAMPLLPLHMPPSLVFPQFVGL